MCSEDTELQVELMARTEPINNLDEEDELYQFYMGMLESPDREDGDIEVECELGCGNEAVVKGMRCVNGRWYDHCPLCPMCTNNMNRIDWTKEDVPDPTEQYETAVGNVMPHVDDDFREAIVEELGFNNT